MRELNSASSRSAWPKVQVYSLEEVIAEKLRAILQKGEAGAAQGHATTMTSGRYSALMGSRWS